MSISVGNKVELRLSLTIWNESRTSLIFWVGTMESKSTDPKFPNVSFSELRLAATFSSSVLMSESNFVDSTASVIASWRNCQTVRIILDRRQMAAKTPYYFIPEEETWKRLKLTNSATYNQHLLRYYNRRVETRAILLGDIFFAIPHVCVCKCMCMCVWVCACMCGCVGVWVCGCVGVWVCGRVGVWVCGYEGWKYSFSVQSLLYEKAACYLMPNSPDLFWPPIKQCQLPPKHLIGTYLRNKTMNIKPHQSGRWQQHPKNIIRVHLLLIEH